MLSVQQTSTVAGYQFEEMGIVIAIGKYKSCQGTADTGNTHPHPPPPSPHTHNIHKLQ